MALTRQALKRKQRGRASSGGSDERNTRLQLGGMLLLVIIAAVVVVQRMEFKLGGQLEDLLVMPRSLADVTSSVTLSMGTTTEDETQTNSKEAFHLLFGLSGKSPYFYEEFDIALKSVLLNAPHHMPLEIHIMCDEDAYQKVTTEMWQAIFFPDAFPQQKVITTADTQKIWFTHVTITTYNVQPFLVAFKDHVKDKSKFRMVLTHTIGAYFRLLCDQVLPSHIERIFYMDTDVVILANLAQILQDAPPQDDNTWILQMQRGCSGVMLINVHQLPRFWDFVAQVDDWGKLQKRNADQDLILGVIKTLDEKHALDKSAPSSKDFFRTLAEPWDLVVARDYSYNTRDKLLQYRPQVGAVHYSGGADKTLNYFREHPLFEDNEKRKGWGIAGAFYIELPWSWVFYMGQSVTVGSNKPPTTIQLQAANLTSKLPPPQE